MGVLVESWSFSAAGGWVTHRYGVVSSESNIITISCCWKHTCSCSCSLVSLFFRNDCAVQATSGKRNKADCSLSTYITEFIFRFFTSLTYNSQAKYLPVHLSLPAIRQTRPQMRLKSNREFSHVKKSSRLSDSETFRSSRKSLFSQSLLSDSSLVWSSRVV